MDVLEVTGQAGAATVGEVLGEAFLEDPFWEWLLRGPDRRRRLARSFGAFAGTAARTPGARLLVTPEHTAAAIWLPPGRWRAGPVEALRAVPAHARALRRGVPRGLRVQAVFERHHLREPHWYLEALGAVPAARGAGVGPRVVQPVLDRCDEDGVPAYLESSNPRNWSFYERLGFVPLDPLPLPAGCPVVLPMLRAPR